MLVKNHTDPYRQYWVSVYDSFEWLQFHKLQDHDPEGPYDYYHHLAAGSETPWDRRADEPDIIWLTSNNDSYVRVIWLAMTPWVHTHPQVRQLHEPEGQVVGDDGGDPAVEGGVARGEAAAALRLQARRLHLRQHPGHRHLRVAPVHHQVIIARSGFAEGNFEICFCLDPCVCLVCGLKGLMVWLKM